MARLLTDTIPTTTLATTARVLDGFITTTPQTDHSGITDKVSRADTDNGKVPQLIPWSGEYNDTEPGHDCGNCHSCNPIDGRWLTYDINTKES